MHVIYIKHKNDLPFKKPSPLNKKMKKVLIITYYWPPSGSSAVQRVVKFAKYLPEFGYQPIVLTVKQGEYNATDESFLDEIPKSVEVIRTCALEPHAVYKLLTDGKIKGEVPLDAMAEKTANWKKKLSFWIRLNLFIPDSRIGWIPFAVQKGKKLIKKKKIDLIFSTAPPPTVHLIARNLAAWSGIKWVADFRDPWTNIHYLQTSERTKFAKKIDVKMEKNVLNSADAVVAVSMLDINMDYKTKVTNKNKFHYIPNGFDENDYIDFSKDTDVIENGKFKIAHIGTIGEERIPMAFYKAISILHKKEVITRENFEINLIGKVEKSNFVACQKAKIDQYVKLIPYVSHREIFKYYQQMNALLLLTYKTPKNIPGKTFEYIRTGKPIIAFGPTTGEAARVLSQFKNSIMIDYDDVDTAVEFLENVMLKYEENQTNTRISHAEVNRFERKQLTEQLAGVFDSLIKD